MRSIVASLCVFLAAGMGLSAQSLDLEAYGKCTQFAVSPELPPPEAVQACLGPARQGVPGAQYALAGILLAQAKSEAPAEAFEWLEKAAQTGHPPAIYLLALLHLGGGEPDLQARGLELMKTAVCSGYPPAQAMRSKVEANGTKLDCGGPVSLDGTWSAALSWVQKSAVSGPAPEMRLTISKGTAKVFLRSGQDWVEVKPGKFEVRQVDDALVISALDSGWDLDGKWIESWTLHLVRLSDQEASLHFVRIVDNLHVPVASMLKVLPSVAEGRAVRSHP